MALQSSGPISLSDIQTEYGGSNPISLSEYYSKGNAPASGAIQLAADFYGTSNAQYVAATGGTVYTSGDYKYHKFTSSSTFTVTNAGNAAGSNTVEYLIVAGGGGGGRGYDGGGGGAGGYRTGTGVSVVAQGYTVTIGAGGAGSTNNSVLGGDGSNSSALGITSEGGGVGGNYPEGYSIAPRSGGSGGGGTRTATTRTT